MEKLFVKFFMQYYIFVCEVNDFSIRLILLILFFFFIFSYHDIVHMMIYVSYVVFLRELQYLESPVFLLCMTELLFPFSQAQRA